MAATIDKMTRVGRLEEKLERAMKRAGKDEHITEKEAKKIASAATALCESPEGRTIFEERYRDDFERAASGELSGMVDPKAREIFAYVVDASAGMDVMGKLMQLGSTMMRAAADKRVTAEEAEGIRKAALELTATPDGREIFQSTFKSDFETIAAGEDQDGVTVEPQGRTVFQTMLKEIASRG